ncbi:hypothetical protein PEDI_28610 [Persicobacter diffluens]|uniref:Uncharacterized protein n=1 Tax=Persicobacter diffluens TaxID=981 RepID=A0AAN4VYG8_9BACT|nr:hypothetical protein PEDI_28610 [Persicobacter diffluens]
MTLSTFETFSKVNFIIYYLRIDHDVALKWSIQRTLQPGLSLNSAKG